MDIGDMLIPIVSLVISTIALLFSIVTFYMTIERDKKQATLDAFNILQNEVFDKLNVYKPAEIQEIANHPTSKEYKEISGYIARLEHFCVGVKMGIYDRETVYQLANGYLNGNQIINRIVPMIERKNRGAKTDYYENIHYLINWMNSKQK